MTNVSMEQIRAIADIGNRIGAFDTNVYADDRGFGVIRVQFHVKHGNGISFYHWFVSRNGTVIPYCQNAKAA